MKLAVALGTLVALHGGVARAHFKLVFPASATEQDSFGGPQKSAPCGITDSSQNPDQSTPTGVVTALQSGATFDLSIVETITHPGHYRVALAQEPALLPEDPPVLADDDSDCGSTMIEPAPAMPLLADGLLVHTSAIGAQTVPVAIPAGVTCTNCVLQVVQFMSRHGLNNPGGCYYHHCARVTIGPDPVDPPPGDAGVDPDPPSGSGGCATGDGPSGLAALAFVLVGLVLRRRA